MRTMGLWLLAGTVAACGAGGAPGTGTGEAASPGAATGAAERAESARLALVDGDLTRAGRLAHQALQLDPANPVAMEVAARGALAEGRHDEVLRVLAGARRPRLVRLRARAHVRAGDMAEAAADLSSVDGREPADGWAEALLPVARAAAGRPLYVLGGAARAALPVDSRAPVPVVEIAVEGRAVSALIATSADLTVLDLGVRATPGVADQLDLGPLSVRGVPVLTRDLSAVSEALGVPIGAVLGTDLMLRVELTIDGRERWVVVRRAGTEASAEAAAVPFVTFEGTFLAVSAVLEDGPPGWYTVDSSGLFPIALAPRALSALGVDPDTLEAAPNAPEGVRMLRLRSVRFGQVQLEDVPAVTGLVPPDLSELAGAPISGILGAALMHQLVVTIDPAGRRILVD